MKRIIVIDDDNSIQHALSIMLERDKFIVDAHTSSDFIFKHDFTPPDVFLIDRRLLGADGLDVCRFLKTNNTTSHIPVIMFSASPAVELLAYQAGADAFIEKPFSINSMRHTLQKFTGAN